MESMESLLATFSNLSPSPLLTNTHNDYLLSAFASNKPNSENSALPDHSLLYKPFVSRTKNTQNARRVAALCEQKAYV